MNTKEEKKEMKACSKTTKFVAFALTGLAVGAAAYYLFGTKEGRKTLNKAVDGVNGLSKTLKAQAEEGLEKAVKLANRAKEEYNKVVNLAEDASHEAMEKANQYKEEAKSLAKKGMDKAKDLKAGAKDYAKQAFEQMEEANRQAKKKVDKA